MTVYLIESKVIHPRHFQLINVDVVAECLSTRLLILQCVFSLGGVWCHASGMQFVTLQECNL